MASTRPIVRVLALAAVILLTALAVAGAALLIPGRYFPFAVIGGICAILLPLIIKRPPWLIYLLAVFAPAVCLITIFDTLEIGGTSLSISGVGWAFVAVLAVGLLGLRWPNLSFPKFLIPFFIFVAWALVDWILTGPTFRGVKDLLFYLLPPLMGLFAYNLISRFGGGVIRTMETLFLWSIVLPAALFAIFLALGSETFTSSGPIGPVESRGIALYLVILLCLAVSRWVYGPDPRSRLWGGLLSLLIFGFILFTLSRMAGGAAALILAVAILKPSTLRQWAIGICAAGIVGFAAIWLIPVFHNRFFFNVNGLEGILTSIRVSGRDMFWQVTFDHAVKSPWIGWGLGSARVIVAQSLTRIHPTEYYPHNEYLQVFHDLGVVGVVLLVAAYGSALWHFWKKWLAGRKLGDWSLSGVNLTAFCCLLAIVLTSITANTLHYPFVTVPAFILIGFAHYQNQQAARRDAEQPPSPDSTRTVAGGSG